MPDADLDHVNAAVMPLVLLLVAAGVMAASGLVALLFARNSRVADRVGAGTLGAGAAIGMAGVAMLFGAASTPVLAAQWALPWGRFSIALDGISAAFLLPLLLIPALASVYGMGYWPQSVHGHTAAKARIFMGLLAASLAVVPLARDAVLFLMAFEVMTLSAFFLITTEDDRDDARKAGWTYFVASHVSLMFLFGAFALYRAATGSFELTAAGASGMGWAVKTVVFLLVLVGFGVKAGIMPLHVWLPGAHATAPSHVSAVLSGVVLKVGIYGLVRMSGILPDPPMFWGLTLLLLGAISGIAGVAYAVGQHDLKRLLAYHSIENIGIIVMGLGVALLGRWAQRPELVALGMACVVMHVWNHALFKSLLFLSAGAVIHAVGTRETDRMGSLARSMPWSAGLFTLGAVAICGLPPLNGFISEFFLFSGALRSLDASSASVASLAAPALALIGALACACFIKVVGSVFLGQPRSKASSHAHECGWAMRAPMVILGAACVFLGLLPFVAAPMLDAATAAWLGDPGRAPALGSLVPFRMIALILTGLVAALALGAVLVAASSRVRASPRAGTWDCGYAAPTARMQYTPSSIARSLVHLLAFVLRPSEHAPRIEGAFPRPVSFESHVEDATLERVVAPFCRRVADRLERFRHWQSGHIQAYIVYVLITTICLLLFVIPFLQLLRHLVTQ